MYKSSRINEFLFASILILCSGCGLTTNQIIKTHSFGASTSDIGNLGELEFINIRNEIIEMNKELVSIDNTKKSESLIFDKPTYAEDTAKRIAASKALKAYGELLVQLVSENRAEGLQKSANALLTNSSVALKNDLSEEKKDAINKIIVGFGSLWVEKKKADAAKSIILAYQQPVEDLANLLSADFSLGDDALGYLKAYEVTAKRLNIAAVRLVNAGNQYSLLERDRAVHAFARSEMAMVRAKELSKKASISIDGLKKANIELVKVMQRQSYETDDIKIYAKQIQELSNMYQVLSH